MRTWLQIVLASALTFCQCATAQNEPRTDADGADVIPSAYPVSRYLAVWENSPFELETPPLAAAFEESASFAEDLAIAGVSQIGGDAAVLVTNRKTKDFLRITKEENADGIRLVSLQKNADPRAVVARIAFGDEVATIRYDIGILNAPLQRVAQNAQKGQGSGTAQRNPSQDPRAAAAGGAVSPAPSPRNAAGRPLQPGAAVSSPAASPPTAQQAPAKSANGAATAQSSSPTSSERRRVVVPKARPAEGEET